jgi:hypothetical protein
MTNLSASEQGLLEEMVAVRSVDVQKPPWMQSHRYTRIKKEARRRIAALPPRPTVSISLPRGTYHANRRVTGTPVGRFTIHESDGDLPVCQLGAHFAAHPEIPRVQIGPGPVTCGHCIAKST